MYFFSLLGKSRCKKKKKCNESKCNFKILINSECVHLISLLFFSLLMWEYNELQQWLIVVVLTVRAWGIFSLGSSVHSVLWNLQHLSGYIHWQSVFLSVRWNNTLQSRIFHISCCYMFTVKNVTLFLPCTEWYLVNFIDQLSNDYVPE